MYTRGRLLGTTRSRCRLNSIPPTPRGQFMMRGISGTLAGSLDLAPRFLGGGKGGQMDRICTAVLPRDAPVPPVARAQSHGHDDDREPQHDHDHGQPHDPRVRVATTTTFSTRTGSGCCCDVVSDGGTVVVVVLAFRFLVTVTTVVLDSCSSSSSSTVYTARGVVHGAHVLAVVVGVEGDVEVGSRRRGRCR